MLWFSGLLVAVSFKLSSPFVCADNIKFRSRG